MPAPRKGPLTIPSPKPKWGWIHLHRRALLVSKASGQSLVPSLPMGAATISAATPATSVHVITATIACESRIMPGAPRSRAQSVDTQRIIVEEFSLIRNALFFDHLTQGLDPFRQRSTQGTDG